VGAFDIHISQNGLAFWQGAWSLSSMQFATPLVHGRLVKRYKRFLADVLLDSGETVTAACPNTGAMLGLTTAGLGVWLSRSASISRKYPHTLEIVERTDVGMIGINTGHPNRLVEEALPRIPVLAGYTKLRREVRYGCSSRIDLLLEKDGTAPCYVEVKNVTLYRQRQLAEFPDCRTERGEKHLREMAEMVRQGCRAVMVYCIQGGQPDAFSLTSDIDPQYCRGFRIARKAGVEALALTCHVSPDKIEVSGQVPILDIP
jgi:sugar fermentation stimulation protein A